MSLWQRWLRQPQNVWLRKANFQIHLWAGIGAGLYSHVVSVSGSALVCRPELSRSFSRDAVIVEGSGAPLSEQELKAAARRVYPGYEVAQLYRDKRPQAAVEVVLER